jgi:long-chain-fatty-acid--CoA ligase ACSBG
MATPQQPDVINNIVIKPLPKYMTLLSNSGMVNNKDVPIDPTTGKNLQWTVDPSVELPIRLGVDPTCMSSRPPTTVIHQFTTTVQKFPQRPALKVKRNGVFIEWTWAEFYRDVLLFAKAAVAAGLPRHGGVAIIGFNSPEWLIANLGAVFAGGMSASIYTTNNAEATWYIANHSQSALAVCEDPSQVQKYVTTMDRLPELRVIIQYTGTLNEQHKASIEATGRKLYLWADFLQTVMSPTTTPPTATTTTTTTTKSSSKSPPILVNPLNGDDETTTLLKQRIAEQQPGHCCTLIYTSGTTGNPKAVMLSHDNLTFTAAASLCEIDINETDRFVSYLPLSHVAAQLLDIHIPMLTGASVTFATPDALKGELVQTLQSVRPTVFFGVPRVWEKIYEKMKEISSKNSYLKQQLVLYAKSIGHSANLIKINATSGARPLTAQQQAQQMPYMYSLFEKMIFSQVKTQLGLDQTRFRATAAAPISKEILDFYMSLDMPLLEIYGMSESSGPHTLNLPHRQKLYSVGTTFPGAYMMLHNVDKDGNGEICMWGRHVFMGYLRDEQNTMATVTKDGYLHTGDVGKVDNFGFLSITGRIKEILITAGGENVAPVPLEDEIKAQLSTVSNVVVIGDKRKFLSAFVTFKTNEDADGTPTDILTDGCFDQLSQAGLDLGGEKSIKKLLADETTKKMLYAYVQEGIKHANSKAVSAAQAIQKFVILDTDFSMNAGELTPTLKLKRKVVLAKYDAIVEQMYDENAPPQAIAPVAPTAKL